MRWCTRLRWRMDCDVVTLSIAIAVGGLVTVFTGGWVDMKASHLNWMTDCDVMSFAHRRGACDIANVSTG